MTREPIVEIEIAVRVRNLPPEEAAKAVEPVVERLKQIKGAKIRTMPAERLEKMLEGGSPEEAEAQPPDS
ncbi:MAG: hypothetical protein ACE5JS_23060, partial [Nitrospinota bacterium]